MKRHPWKQNDMPDYRPGIGECLVTVASIALLVFSVLVLLDFISGMRMSLWVIGMLEGMR